MSKHIAPLNGNSLSMLKIVLSRRVSDLLWLFGCSSTQWIKMTSRGDNDLTARHCLLIRALTLRPEFDPTPEPPSAKELLEVIQDIDPNFSASRLPTLLGLEPSGKDRLLDPNFHNTVVVSHYMMVIHNALTSADSVSEKKKRLQLFKDLVEIEGQARGLDVDKLWRRGGWRKFGSGKRDKKDA